MKANEKIQMELMQELVMPIQRIAEHLQKQVETDEELAAAIENKENKTLKKCYDYIVSQARSHAGGKNAVCVDDSTVFNWAREYYIKEEKPKDEKPKEEKPKTEKKKTAPKKEAKVEEKPAEEVIDGPKEVSEDEEDWLA